MGNAIVIIGVGIVAMLLVNIHYLKKIENRSRFLIMLIREEKIKERIIERLIGKLNDKELEELGIIKEGKKNEENEYF